MDSTDRISLDDLSDVRKAVSVLRFRSIFATGVGGVIFSAFMVAVWLLLRPGEISAAIFLASVTYLLFGLPLLVHWVRHWRRIYQRLTDVELRVQAGEVVYGSQVQFL